LFVRLREASGIKTSGAALYFPCRSKLWLATIWREDMPVERGDEPVVYYNLIAGDYFRAMGIPLVSGRFFTERELWESSDAVLINQTMARELFSGADPLERRIKDDEGGNWYRIVGVVGDVRQKSLNEPSHAEYYVPFPQMPMPFMTIAAETSVPDAVALEEIQKSLHAVDPGITVNNLARLDTLLANTVMAQRLAMVLLLLFAGLALGLSALGIYGVMSFAVNQRITELGIRMALGAAPAQVFRLVVIEGLKTALVGCTLGVTGAIASSRVLGSLLYQAQAFDWSVCAVIVVLTALAAFAALSLPACRAASVDPVVAIRSE
jgi:putative ABC transport system permease protein